MKLQPHEAATVEEASEVASKEASTVEGCLKQYRMKLQPLRRRPKRVNGLKVSGCGLTVEKGGP